MLCLEPKYYRILPVLLMALALPARAQDGAEAAPGPDIHTDLLYGDKDHFYQDIYYKTAQDLDKTEIALSTYIYGAIPGQDSLLVYTLNAREQSFRKGAGICKLDFNHAGTRSYILPAYREVLSRTGLVPVGRYRIFVELKQAGTVQRFTFLYERDSALAAHSGIRKGLAKLLSAGGHPNQHSSAVQALERARLRMDHYFRKKGLSQRRTAQEDKEIIDLYYKEWFMGRYALSTRLPLEQQLRQQAGAAGNQVGDMARNGLGDYTSLMSQFREMKKEWKEEKELVGTVSLGAQFSNDQETGSQQENTFYEARGMLEFPLLDIPVSVSGYYTTQDRNREAKASYVHFRYDAEKAKEQLMKLIGSYNSRYQQTLAQGANYDMIYGQFVQQLRQQKDKAIAELKRDAGLDHFDPASFPAQAQQQAQQRLQQQKDQWIDSLKEDSGAGKAAAGLQEKQQQAMALKQEGEEYYNRIMQQYEKIQALEQKIERYRSLLDQYKNTAAFDSALAYGKLKEMGDLDKMSYKDMAQKASALLPEGKVKGALTGLTNFDAGMFPKYVSDYTLSGQVLKGADLGYDLGFAQAGLTYGSTEYIDREGKVERYKSYGLRSQFKPVLGQSFGLVYFGYSPSRKLLEDNRFFKGDAVSLPSFRNPVHILSLTYSGQISTHLRLSGEYASAFKPAQSEEARATGSFRERSAYNIQLSGTIPGTTLDLATGYEYAGKAFENNTMPLPLAGTERILVKGKGDFFRSFLSLGVEYNYMIQHNLHSKGSNSRWGFDIATHSRRYPSLSLSYKPFSTFRSFDDTLQIAQKPMVGEVWTGRLSYQVKKQEKALRFNLLYNYNNSTMDTVAYNSSLIEFGVLYTREQWMLNLSAGSNKLATTVVTVYPAYNNSTFFRLSAGIPVLRTLYLTLGGDVAYSNMGISRYSGFTGAVYRFARLPLMLRGNFRYSNFRMNEVSGWKELYSGGLELAWRFKVKINDK